MLPTTLQFLIPMIASTIIDRLQRKLDYVGGIVGSSAHLPSPNHRKMADRRHSVNYVRHVPYTRAFAALAGLWYLEYLDKHLPERLRVDYLLGTEPPAQVEKPAGHAPTEGKPAAGAAVPASK